MLLFGYRYMWRLKGSTQIFFKVVVDTDSNLSVFEKQLISQFDGLESFAREYLFEFDVSKIGKFDNLLKKDGDLDEEA